MMKNGQRSTLFRICMAAGLGVAMMATAVDGAQAMSSRQCREQWRAQRATLRTQGHTRRTFMRACRTGAKQPSAPKQAAPTTH